VKESLQFIAEHGDLAGGSAAKRRRRSLRAPKTMKRDASCLDGLSRIRSSKAKNELLASPKTPTSNKTLRDTRQRVPSWRSVEFHQ
jgi:hypothetical protein